jgi:hypothetical protein
MAGEQLHEYDLRLCTYVLCNILEHTGRPQYTAWLGKRLGPGPLWQYISSFPQGDRNSVPKRLLLSEKELSILSEIFRDQWVEWSPYVPLHKLYIMTVREVRDALSQRVEQRWSDACENFARKLEGDSLSLAPAIEIVQEWVCELRFLLQAMGATAFLPCPEGRSPTPTNPTPRPNPAATLGPPADTSDENMNADIVRMRQAIRERSNGATAKASTLCKDAQINPQRGRRALRWLEEQGEYNGFLRKAPSRRNQGERSTQR